MLDTEIHITEKGSITMKKASVKRLTGLFLVLILTLTLVPMMSSATEPHDECYVDYLYDDNPATLLNGFVGHFYADLIRTESCESVVFENYENNLPPGLTLNEDGGIVGTPTTAGTYTFLVEGMIPRGEIPFRTRWQFTITIHEKFAQGFRVKKVDQYDNLLDGAVLVVGPREGYESPLPTYTETTSGGYVSFTVEKPGYYTLYEEQAPDGYTKSDAEYYLYISGEGVFIDVGQYRDPYELVTFVNIKNDEPRPNGYVVHFDLQGGYGGSATADQWIPAAGGYAVKPVADPVKDGFLFIGWYHAPGSTMMWDFNNTLVSSETGDVTIYAKWAPALERGDHFRYINGYTDGTVRPENPIARSEVAAIFFRIITDPDKNDPLTTSFPDVDPIYKWSYQPIAYLEAHGIITGYPDGRFGPDDPITRAEFAAIAARFDALIIDDTNIFADVSDTYWAKGYINSAYNHGWINGYDDGFTLTFRPRANITRAEVMTIVNRMLDRRIRRADVPAACNPFSDLDYDYWAYATVLEASIAHDYERQDDGYELWTDWTPWS